MRGVTQVRLVHTRVKMPVCLPSLIKNSTISFEGERSSRMRKCILMKKVETCKAKG